MRKIKTILITLLILSIMLLTACSSKTKEPVQTSTVPVKPVQNTVEASGVVKASNLLNIAIDMPMEVGTRVEKIFVKEGQRVKKGDKLVKLDLDDYYALVAQKVRTIQADQILKKDMQTENQKDAQDLKVQGERAELNTLRSKIRGSYFSNGNIVCSFDNAVVTDISYRQGDVINPQLKVLSLQDVNSLFIEADVPEEFIKDVSVGKTVAIMPKMDTSIKLTGRVTRIYSEAVNRNGETIIPVEISIDNNNMLLPNYNVDVEINKN